VRLASLAVLLAVVVAPGCGGATKAGTKERHRIVLTLASHDTGNRDLREYVDAVERLSSGSIRIEIEDQWRPGARDPDRATLADVRAGRVDLAKVGVDVYDSLGVHAFDAVSAPFLIDGLAVERRVLVSGLTQAMLADVRRIGVDGLALLPGEPRRPVGLEHALRAPSDYDGDAVGIPRSRVAALALRALGATARPYSAGELTPWAFDGAVLDLATLELDQPGIQNATVTANVAFGPRLLTVVGNPRVLARLSGEQRDVLETAGRDALPAAIARLREEASGEPGVLCRRDRLRFVRAASGQVAALRHAARPVLSALERDPATRSRIRAIQGMKRGAKPDPPADCARRAAPRVPAIPLGKPRQTPLDGTWTMTATVADIMTATHGTRADAAVDAGRYRMVLRGGRAIVAHVGQWGGRGPGAPFGVRNDIVEFRFPDELAVYRFHVYRDTLRLQFPPGERRGAPNPTFAPWHRVGP
jgi:TRAP-type C4-dicarboxylate transport system substrate-binding protein